MPIGFASSFKWSVPRDAAGRGLEREVSDYLKISPGDAAALIDFGSVYVLGRIERNPARTLRGGEEISVTFPTHGISKFYEIDPSRILLRDRFLFAYDKEHGIPSQQTPSDAYNNVFAALLRHLEKERSAGGPYAALHHRLDMETSGVIVFALNRNVNRALGAAFQERRVRKEYLAWVEGVPELDEWTGNWDIGKKGGKYVAVPSGKGMEARTDFRALRREGDRTLVQAVPHTGRTHQIRIHLASSGHPIAGDRAYGAKPADRLYLHAFRLALKHPASREPLILEAPIPWPGTWGGILSGRRPKTGV